MVDTARRCNSIVPPQKKSKRKILRVSAIDETRPVRQETRVLHEDFGAHIRQRVHCPVVLGQVPGPCAANSVDRIRRDRRTRNGRLHVGNILAVRQPKGNRATRWPFRFDRRPRHACWGFGQNTDLFYQVANRDHEIVLGDFNFLSSRYPPNAIRNDCYRTND